MKKIIVLLPFNIRAGREFYVETNNTEFLQALENTGKVEITDAPKATKPESDQARNVGRPKKAE